MARYVIDATAALELAARGFDGTNEHEIYAPTLVRSQALSLMYEAVARGELTYKEAQDRLELIRKMPTRLLGDGVLRRTAWKVADELGWPDTYAAEYVALTRLHGDALITADKALAKQLKGVVETADVDVLLD